MQEGKIFYNEEEITENNKDDFLFYHVSYIDQDGQYLKNMTIYQHFEFYAKLHHLSIDKELVKKYLDKVHLENIEISIIFINRTKKKISYCFGFDDEKRYSYFG